MNKINFNDSDLKISRFSSHISRVCSSTKVWNVRFLLKKHMNVKSINRQMQFNLVYPFVPKVTVKADLHRVGRKWATARLIAFFFNFLLAWLQWKDSFASAVLCQNSGFVVGAVQFFWVTNKPDRMHFKLMNLYPCSIPWWFNCCCRNRATSSTPVFTLRMFTLVFYAALTF